MTLAVLTTPRALPEAVWSVWSWMRFVAQTCAARIVIDGDCDFGESAAVQSVLPGVQIDPAGTLTRSLKALYPGLREFADTHPLGTKLVLTLALQAESDLLYSDSDVLVFNNPQILATRITGRVPSYNQEEHSTSYDPAMIAAGERTGMRPADRVNSGLFFLPRQSIPLERAEVLIREWRPGGHSWFSEQAAMALLLNEIGGDPLPANTYVVSNARQFWWQKDVDYGAIHTRHFTGPTRHLLYSKGLRYLRQTIAGSSGTNPKPAGIMKN